jgi:ABC-type nitrate/sulfonate/bicarbonate transport system substrate-binding protein
LITETVLAREAGLRVIGTAEDMPLGCDSGVVVTVGAIAERPQEIRAFIRAVQRAVQFMQADRAESVRILADWSQVDERDAASAYDLANVQVSYSTDKAAGQRAIEQAILYSKEAGEVDPGIQFDDIADLSLYP